MNIYKYIYQVSTAALNLVVKEALEWQAPAQVHSKKSVPKIYYANQVTHSPPTIVFFVNKPSFFSDNYVKYLERKVCCCASNIITYVWFDHFDAGCFSFVFQLFSYLPSYFSHSVYIYLLAFLH
jgi:hypothetical protein